MCACACASVCVNVCVCVCVCECGRARERERVRAREIASEREGERESQREGERDIMNLLLRSALIYQLSSTRVHSAEVMALSSKWDGRLSLRLGRRKGGREG